MWVFYHHCLLGLGEKYLSNGCHAELFPKWLPYEEITTTKVIFLPSKMANFETESQQA